jgi:hypothetical protein
LTKPCISGNIYTVAISDTTLSERGYLNMQITGELLSGLTLQESEALLNSMKKPSYEQKIKAWQKMDTGIYDSDGKLIGDKCEEEDAYYGGAYGEQIARR